MKRHIYKALAVVFAAICLYDITFAQQDLTIHLLPIIPQSNYTNPSFMPTAKVHVGFPGLSSVYLGVSHSGFAYKDLFTLRDDDSLQLTMDKVMDKLGKKNYLSAQAMEEILSFGFKIKKNYFNFSLTEKVSVRFSYPKDLIGLAWKGNGQFIGSTADLSGIGVNAIHYREFAVGYARDLNDKFVVGGRFKYLQGFANIYTKHNDVTVDINEDDYAHTAHTNFLVNVCLPDALLDSVNHDSIKSNDVKMKAGDYLMNNSNKGFAVDLGATYKYNDKLTFGLSVLDFGGIKWKTGKGSTTKNYSNEVDEFTFDGIDINEFFNENDSVIDEKFNTILDSLSDIFKIQEKSESYWAPLTSKIYLTGVYTLTPHDKVGLLIRTEIFNKQLHPAFTASYNKWFGKMFSAAVSYSVMNRSYTNIGFGLALNLGPFQTYIVGDNLYALMKPTGSRAFNIHFGFNFIFGYKEVKPNDSLYKDTTPQ
jgi:hypothetical protein